MMKKKAKSPLCNLLRKVLGSHMTLTSPFYAMISHMVPPTSCKGNWRIQSLFQGSAMCPAESLLLRKKGR